MLSYTWSSGSGGAAESSTSTTIDWALSADTETSVTATPIFLRKNGSVVTCTFGDPETLGSGGFTKDGEANVYVAGVIPSDYRPSAYVTAPFHMAVGATKSFGLMIVYPDGSVDFWKTAAEGPFANADVVTFPYCTTMSWVKF